MYTIEGVKKVKRKKKELAMFICVCLLSSLMMPIVAVASDPEADPGRIGFHREYRDLNEQIAGKDGRGPEETGLYPYALSRGDQRKDVAAAN